MADRPTIDVPAVTSGWPPPWPNVAELADHLPHEQWTLIGGLMVQLHAVYRGIGVMRPTNDVDVVLHVETSRGVPSTAATVLESLGYRLVTPLDPRNDTAHRFVRDDARIDLVTSARDTVDVLMADHAAPRMEEKLRGMSMVRIEGGTQALRRTVNARLRVTDGHVTTISVPNPFGALVLKAAAFQTDTRDRDRHLYDAAVLLCCIDDPYLEREQFAGSDPASAGTVGKVPEYRPSGMATHSRSRTYRWAGGLATALRTRLTDQLRLRTRRRRTAPSAP